MIFAPPPNNCYLFAKGGKTKTLFVICYRFHFLKKIDHSFFTSLTRLLIRFVKKIFTLIHPMLHQATMEEPTPSTSSQTDMLNNLSPSSKPEDKWPSLSSTASSIQPVQKASSMPASWTAQTTKKIPPQDHMKNRGKYSQYFQRNKILPIPELVQEVQPKTISFVVTDLKTRRLAGLRKDTFEEI